MTKPNDSPERPRRVSEPVQVYLDRSDRGMLESLASRLGATKSEILRRGLAALEREVTDPARNPLLSVIGIAGREAEAPIAYNVGVEHDRFLADLEDAQRQRGRTAS